MVAGWGFLFVLELVELFQIAQTGVDDAEVFGQVEYFSADFDDFVFLCFEDGGNFWESLFGSESGFDLFEGFEGDEVDGCG